MNEKYTVSVIVITYNADKYIVPCLKSVLNSRGVVVDEIIVVDNASSDDTVSLIEEYFSSDTKVKVVRLRKNLGFPLACNVSVARARNELVMLMNPDVVVDPYCFARLVEVLSGNDNVAVAQPKILHLGGYIDSAGGMMDVLGHGSHIGKFERDYGLYDEPSDILYATFACAMVRRSIYLRHGGMDSRYFLYNEDLDFCWRSRLSGYQVVYVPKAVAYHIGQHVTKKAPYHSLYFGRRNRLFTIFTNYSLPLNIITSGILTSLYIALIPYSIIRGDKMESRIMIYMLMNIPKHMKYLAYKRFLVSRLRKLGDFTLIRRGLITTKLIGLRLFLTELYKRMLNLP